MARLFFTGRGLVPCDVVVGLPVQGAKHFPLHLIDADGIAQFCDILMEFCQQFSSVDVVVSLTVLDKAFHADGMNGGLSTRELLYLLNRLKLMRNFSGVEVLGSGELAEQLKTP